MKKAVLVLTVLALCLCGAFSAQAASCSVRLEGEKSIRAGEEIRITLAVSGTALAAVQGTVQYDSTQLQYKGYSGGLDGWATEVEASGGKISVIAYDNNQSKPLNGYKQLVTLRFSVQKNLAEGSAAVVTAAGFSCSDGEKDFSAANNTLRMTVKAPPSGENRLSSLSSPDGSLQPAFAPGVTRYTLNVPYEISRLTLNATTKDAKAKTKLSTSSLRVGKNTVHVTVTAENKSIKTYTITVERAPDPNAPTKAVTTAKGSTDSAERTDKTSGTAAVSTAGSARAAAGSTALKALHLEAGLLSPVFSPDVTQYIVYLPYEIHQITLRGTPLDSAARCDALELTGLPEGDTPARLTVSSADGSETAYEILIRRLPQYVPGETETEKDTAPKTSGLSYTWLALLIPLCIVLGAGGTLALGRRRRR